MNQLLLLPCLLAAAAASAQTVYRCGPDGREYQATPCPGGQPVNVADPRGEAQRHEAAQLAQREAALAQQLRREQAPAGGAVSVQPAVRPARIQQPEAESAKPPPRHHGQRHHPLGPDERLARAPKADAPKKKPKAAATAEKPQP